MKFSEKTKSDIDETGNDVLQKIKDMDQETSNNLLGIILNDTIKSIFNLACDLQDIVVGKLTWHLAKMGKSFSANKIF